MNIIMFVGFTGSYELLSTPRDFKFESISEFIEVEAKKFYLSISKHKHLK
jgi:hypothetical protein